MPCTQPAPRHAVLHPASYLGSTQLASQKSDRLRTARCVTSAGGGPEFSLAACNSPQGTMVSADGGKTWVAKLGLEIGGVMASGNDAWAKPGSTDGIGWR